MNFSDAGRNTLGVLALLVIGFALGSLVMLTVEEAAALAGAAVVLLLLTVRRGESRER